MGGRETLGEVEASAHIDIFSLSSLRAWFERFQIDWLRPTHMIQYNLSYLKPDVNDFNSMGKQFHK